MIFVVIVFAVDVVECTARNMKSISVEERHRDGVEGRGSGTALVKPTRQIPD
jgi:hypothetical protein